MTVNVSKPAINVREKLAELDKPTGIAGEAMLRAETPQEQFNLIGAGRKNIFINGGFTVSQRGDFTSATATSSNSYGLDRWKNYLTNVSATYQHTTVTINGVTKRALKMAATSSANGLFGPVQQVELSAFQDGVDLTMSGYVRTNNPSVYFRHDYVAGVTGIQSPNRIPDDENWHYVTWTINTAGTTQTPIFQVLAYDYGNVSVTSGDYIEIADMQLEVGKVATPFEHRSYGEELALCQRYYYRIDSANNSSTYQRFAVANIESGTQAEGFFIHPVQMRTNPTLGVSAASDFHVYTANATKAVSGLVIDQSSPLTAGVAITATAMTAGYVGLLNANNNNDAWIEFKAEL
jgi:hypothetical protein